MKRTHWWGRVYLLAVFAVMYTPIVYLMYYSFNSGGTMHDFQSFTFKWYRDVLSDDRLLIIVLNTIVIALLSAAVATILGVIGALAIYYVKRQRTKNALLALNNVLIVSPDVIIGASFLLLFTVAGIKLGFTSVLLSHIAFSVPIVVLMVLPKLEEMSPTLIDAARDLGASHWQVLSGVVLPFLAPSIWAGFFMALTYSLDDFAVTFLSREMGSRRCPWKFIRGRAKAFPCQSTHCRRCYFYLRCCSSSAITCSAKRRPNVRDRGRK